ncbi:hypothetical protein [Crossiella sp. CA198]|uniref:hypothetical protein n=1 Tax=Crossiella sp. CA198 TaxID=3455607 RepID=UPI003F8D2854
MTAPATTDNAHGLRCALPAHHRFPVVATTTTRSPRTKTSRVQAYCGICASCVHCGQLGAILDTSGRVLCRAHHDPESGMWFTELTHFPEAFCTVAHQPPRPAVAALATCTSNGTVRLDWSTRLCRDCAMCARPDCTGEGVQLDIEDRPRCFEHRHDDVRTAGQTDMLVMSMQHTWYFELLRDGA